MPRFYFDMSLRGGCIRDEEGEDLPDLSAALHKAKSDAHALASDFLRGGGAGLPELIFVLDDDRQELSAVEVRTTLLEAIESAFDLESTAVG